MKNIAGTILVLGAQFLWVVFTYWMRTQTLDSDSALLHLIKSFAHSDLFTLIVPYLGSVLAMTFLFRKKVGTNMYLALLRAAAVATLCEGAALVVAFNNLGV